MENEIGEGVYFDNSEYKQLASLIEILLQW